MAGVTLNTATSTFYGTTAGGGSTACTGGCGVAFTLTPAAGGTVWTQSIVHSLAGGDDGANPLAGLYIDSTGKIYGTTASGGTGNLGTAFRLRQALPRCCPKSARGLSSTGAYCSLPVDE